MIARAHQRGARSNTPPSRYSMPSSAQTIGDVDPGSGAVLHEPARFAEARDWRRESRAMRRVGRVAAQQAIERGARSAEPTGDIDGVAGARAVAAKRVPSRAEHGDG